MTKAKCKWIGRMIHGRLIIRTRTTASIPRLKLTLSTEELVTRGMWCSLYLPLMKEVISFLKKIRIESAQWDPDRKRKPSQMSFRLSLKALRKNAINSNWKMQLSVLKIRLLNVNWTILRISLPRNNNKPLNQQLQQPHQYREICRIHEEDLMKMIKMRLKTWPEERETMQKFMMTVWILKLVLVTLTVIRTLVTPRKYLSFLKERMNQNKTHQGLWLWGSFKREACLRLQLLCVFAASPLSLALWNNSLELANQW